MFKYITKIIDFLNVLIAGVLRKNGNLTQLTGFCYLLKINILSENKNYNTFLK